MKRMISLILTAVLLLSGCAGKRAPEPAPAETAAVTEAPTETAAPETEVPSVAAEPEAVPNAYADGRDRPSSRGALQVKDGKLCGADGMPVMLRGVSSYGISMSENMINEPLFTELSRDMGVNVFRLAMYTHGVGVVGYCTGGDQQKLKQLVYDGVDYAGNQDMYAIVDWHILQDGNPNTYVEEAKLFFAEMAEAFCGKNHVLYEICNEPNGVDWAEIKRYAEAVIPVIREKDPDSVIIVGTPTWSQEVDKALADPLEFDNVLYTLHFYSASHKEELRTKAEQASQAGLPIFVTEYGVTSSSGGFPRDLEEADTWIDMLERENISYCMWSFSKVAEPCSAVHHSVMKNSGFTEEDFTPTGKWLAETLRIHGGNS